ncbi:MAG: diguanylate cyclase [Candidatus Aminicenantes bacterium]|nr:diguanylate cyclase [Candidatus Aminicenantes bacterium]
MKNLFKKGKKAVDLTIHLDDDSSPHDEKPASGPESIEHPVLQVMHGNDKGKIFILKGEMRAGRDKSADIILNDKLISRLHLTIIPHKGLFEVVDNGSTNGTFIDGQKIDRKKIKPGSVLQMGRTTIRLLYMKEKEIHAEEELYKSATTDELTGVTNRHWFMKRTEEEFVFAHKRGLPLSLVMFDIDFFKKVNDTYGHQAGDYVLRKITELINLQKRDEDHLGRYGGEEFILFLKGIPKDNAFSVCERMRKNVEETVFEFQGKSFQITISMGLCSMAGSEITSLEECIRRADSSLYEAKKTGRNRVVSYD